MGSQDGASPQTPLEESPLSSGWSQTCLASLTPSATVSTELLVMESSASTPQEERALAMEILVRSGTKSVSCPSGPPLVVKLDTPLGSPGWSTIWTGSSLRLECNCS